ncbi:MAG: Septum formation initiator [Anaerocolumna sp.]|jgi:cell division protein FtsL|nr:Septum formation initiator [Anaerocolumna sp.]
MEAKKQRYQNTNSYYIDGNTARKLQAVPNHREDTEINRRQQPIRETRKQPRMGAGIDLFSAFFLTVAIVVTLYSCITYLGVQANKTQMQKEITKLERNLTKLQDENHAELSKLNTSLDLNYIYQVATTELGMVYPNENQVITYKSNLSDYVRQYEEIPEANGTSLLDKITN